MQSAIGRRASSVFVELLARRAFSVVIPPLIGKSQVTMNTDLGKKLVLGTSFGLVALMLAGCSPPTATVSGTVTYKNKPLPGGSVTFVTPTGTAQGAINSEGAYTAENVPVGNAKVTVYYSSGPKMPFGGNVKGVAPKDASPEAQKAVQGPKASGPTINIPTKYGDPESSGLTVVVTSGKNSPYNIELKD